MKFRAVVCFVVGQTKPARRHARSRRFGASFSSTTHRDSPQAHYAELDVEGRLSELFDDVIGVLHRVEVFDDDLVISSLLKSKQKVQSDHSRR